MKDNVIEIARFGPTNEAEVLANLLKAEGVDCFVRDSLSNYGVMDIKVDILRKDAHRALEIMKDHNYEIPNILLETISGDTEQEGENKDEYEAEDKYDEIENSKSKLSKYMTIIIIMMVILFSLLVFLNKYFNG